MKNTTEDKLLGELNDFMKDYGIKEISFSKKHKIKKTKKNCKLKLI